MLEPELFRWFLRHVRVNRIMGADSAGYVGHGTCFRHMICAQRVCQLTIKQGVGLGCINFELPNCSGSVTRHLRTVP
jgi:hypothetical protein